VRSTALAIGLAAVLGVAGGVVTAFALPQHVEDPLHLGAALVNQPCRPGQSVVILASGAPSSLLSSWKPTPRKSTGRSLIVSRPPATLIERIPLWST